MRSIWSSPQRPSAPPRLAAGQSGGRAWRGRRRRSAPHAQPAELGPTSGLAIPFSRGSGDAPWHRSRPWRRTCASSAAPGRRPTSPAGTREDRAASRRPCHCRRRSTGSASAGLLSFATSWGTAARAESSRAWPAYTPPSIGLTSRSTTSLAEALLDERPDADVLVRRQRTRRYMLVERGAGQARARHHLGQGPYVGRYPHQRPRQRPHRTAAPQRRAGGRRVHQVVIQPHAWGKVDALGSAGGEDRLGADVGHHVPDLGDRELAADRQEPSSTVTTRSRSGCSVRNRWASVPRCRRRPRRRAEGSGSSRDHTRTWCWWRGAGNDAFAELWVFSSPGRPPQLSICVFPGQPTSRHCTNSVSRASWSGSVAGSLRVRRSKDVSLRRRLASKPPRLPWPASRRSCQTSAGSRLPCTARSPTRSIPSASGTRQSTPTTSAPASPISPSISPVPTPKRIRHAERTGPLEHPRGIRIHMACVASRVERTGPLSRTAGPRRPRPRPAPRGRPRRCR